jgi:hypothetical protein
VASGELRWPLTERPKWVCSQAGCRAPRCPGPKSQHTNTLNAQGAALWDGSKPETERLLLLGVSASLSRRHSWRPSSSTAC